MSSTVVALLISLLVLAAAGAGGAYAYKAGQLDPIIAKISAYMAKAKAEAALQDGQKQVTEQTDKVLDEGAEQTEAAQEAVGSVGDGIDLDLGDGELKKRL